MSTSSVTRPIRSFAPQPAASWSASQPSPETSPRTPPQAAAQATSHTRNAGSPLARHADSLADSFAASYAGVVAFLTVAAEGNFARAGDRLGIGRSAISRSVQKLEAQLGVRLFVRTTRSTSLTAEGKRFYEQCHPAVARIVHALDDMRELREGPPSGRLRVWSPVSFGRRVVAPLLAGFREAHPNIAIELLLDDGAPDFSTDRVDIAFRNGRMEDSQVIARKVIPMQMMLCASPEYAARHGLPQSVEALAEHRCVNFRLASGRLYEWEFRSGGQLCKVSPDAMLTFNDADLVLQSVLDGHGIAQLAAYQVGDHLRAGTLVTCLSRHAPDDCGHYLCFPSREHLPARMRAFIDYMTDRIRAMEIVSSDWPCPDHRPCPPSPAACGSRRSGDSSR